MSELVQVLPHATTACVPVLNWWIDNAPTERAPVSIAVSNIFLTMYVLLSGKKPAFVLLDYFQPHRTAESANSDLFSIQPELRLNRFGTWSSFTAKLTR